MTVLVRYSKDVDVEFKLETNLVTVDPANAGALLGWDAFDRRPWPRRPDWYVPLHGGLIGAAELRKRAAEIGPIATLVVEDQFVGAGASAAIKTVFSAGFITGTICAATHVGKVVLVKPASWQSKLPKDPKPGKGAGKRRSMAHAKAFLPGWPETIATVARRQGAADAFCMADWYRRLAT